MNLLRTILALMLIPLTAYASHFGLFFQSNKSWPAGTDGVVALMPVSNFSLSQSTTYPGKLKITNGSTQTFDNIGKFINVAGVNDNVCVLDFKSLAIPQTTNLSIDSACSWTVIGVAGVFNLDGIILANKNYVGANTTFNMKEPGTTGALTGTTLSYNTAQSAGGVGGSGGYTMGFGGLPTMSGGIAAASFAGNASGGGSGGFQIQTSAGAWIRSPGSNSGAVTFSAAGLGASNSNTAATSPGQNGASSSSVYEGGNGGFRGAHGQGIYLKLKGQSTGTGLINVNGFPGGSGGNTMDWTSIAAVQGGSGGSGGGVAELEVLLDLLSSSTQRRPQFLCLYYLKLQAQEEQEALEPRA